MPMPFEEQALAIYAGDNGYLDDIPVEDVVRFRTEMLDYVRSSQAKVFEDLRSVKKFTDDIKSEANAAIEQFKKQFASSATA
jgi:F-type H+-transporting ATPase subunit alpha